jgi:hypothetical protein
MIPSGLTHRNKLEFVVCKSRKSIVAKSGSSKNSRLINVFDRSNVPNGVVVTVVTSVILSTSQSLAETVVIKKKTYHVQEFENFI